MKMKCVFRDMMGVVRVLNFDAGSVQAATVGLHDRCRETINAVDSVDKSQLMIWLEYLIDEDGVDYRILYRSEHTDDEIADSPFSDTNIVYIDEAPFPEQSPE